MLFLFSLQKYFLSQNMYVPKANVNWGGTKEMSLLKDRHFGFSQK